jgi:tetratricopeptide (TPR) repeat protein
MSTISIQQAMQMAVQHHNARRLREASAIYRKIIAADPNHLDATFNLGLIARQVGQPAEAAALWQRVSTARPDRADVAYQLAHALVDANEPYQAATVARQALARAADHAELHAILGRALAVTRKFDEAISAAQRAVELQPDHAEIRNHLGLVFFSAARRREAEAEFVKAVQLNPKIPGYHRNLAAVRDALDELDGAVEAADEALRLGGDDAQVLANVSSLHRRRRDYPAALGAAERAVKARPNLAAAHGSKAIALLSLGEYEQGFVEYEWRWRCENFTTSARDFGRPMWDGSDPTGRRIFVHTEQGYGDVIQFARYIPMLAARGASIFMESHPALRPLMKRLGGVTKVVPAGMRPPDFDLHTPLLSLPRWFGTTMQTIPSDVPYLSPDPDRVAAWKARITAPGLKVGVIWSGNIKPDPNRTCPLSNFAPLAAVANVAFYSLQVGDAARDIASAPQGISFTDLSADLTDFTETAAAMQCLDLVLTIDTAGAHLAGALGRPVWTLLPWAPDWRWMLDRDDSPWYPTMRLFRQHAKRDWSEAIRQVADALGSYSIGQGH